MKEKGKKGNVVVAEKEEGWGMEVEGHARNRRRMWKGEGAVEAKGAR